MKRSITLGVLIALVFPVLGQDQMTVHRFSCPLELVGSAEKLIITEVKALDPNGRISIDGRALKVAVRNAFDRAQVWSAIRRSGVCDPEPLPINGRSNDGPNGSGPTLVFPEYYSTGDPVQDDAAYEMAKRAWITAHPAEYEQMQTSSPE
ncbi:MAG: hypothetical protein IPO56_15865 [Flavobacteriales bacterium]|jgi:hypothetical protein|nr:hypothetical protein [Flavobacteriales bacterium]MBK7103485.1 hypothetical protein [Flavobacteriales bacterium]MBK9629121.1 hypothetical protein [Flavobacteriales bacterium]HQW07286.1 hypothetical protein [Flavobacteriales bacterium]